MTEYVLIESHNPMESIAAVRHLELAAALAGDGHQVTVFLVQNGVLPARKGAQAAVLEQLASAGVNVLADDFSLRERGIAADALRRSCAAAPLETIVDGLARGARTVWH